jgi:predicted RNase H-like HicB family nuclease
MRRVGKRAFSVIIELDGDGYYVASVPELPGCHTQARSLDTLIKRVREAIEVCLEVEQEGQPTTEFVGVQRVTV